MNILKFHRGLIENYKTYIQSFVILNDRKIAKKHPSANWIEQNIALDNKEGILVHLKSVTLLETANKIAEY